MDRSDPLFNSVLACVVTLHGLFILLCCLSIFVVPSPSIKSGQKLKVQTVNLSEPQAASNMAIIESKTSPTSIPAAEVKSKAKEQPAPKLELKASPKTEVKPQPEAQPKVNPQLRSSPKPQPKIQPKSPPKPQPPKPHLKTSSESKPIQSAQKEVKHKSDVERQKLLSKAKETLGQIKVANHKSPVQTNQNIATHPQPLEKLQSEAYITNESLFGSERDGKYRDELITRLKRYLKLPGYGDITIELILERSGTIKALKILKDENSENRKYIEKILPTLSFPNFGSSYEKESQHSFVITLTNDL